MSHNEPEETQDQTPPKSSASEDPAFQRGLRPEDQARVDGFLKRGVNSVERKPFKPLHLLVILVFVVISMSVFSQWLAHRAGVF
ncbi:MAG: DUF3094 family protein [Congregibacter sp.]